MLKFPVGVIGVGHLGSLHAKMYAEIPFVELIGMMDVDRNRSESLARELDVKAFDSVDELLKNVKAVSIATPTSTHCALAQQAIQQGIHVLIEKPITKTITEAELLITLAKKNGVKIQVGHIERFNPALLALEHYHLHPMFIESHRLAQFNPRGTDVAVVLDLMIHDIDIILSLVHSPVEKIEANGIAVVSDNIDIANARLQFENGCVANVTASRISQKKMRKMRMFQRDAYISVDFSEGIAEVFRLVDEDDKSAEATMMLGAITSGSRKRKIIYEQPEIKEVNALKYELETFIGSIQNGKEPMVTAEEGLQALQIAHAIMEKIHQQKISL
ncbi:MAG: Gfo/Idh/MocA family oxidoreductase [Ignavibacteriae bacterium]|nr:Gfo/Idh/MocA family oxidoreductase [Ignavibacteriota bacterium]